MNSSQQYSIGRNLDPYHKGWVKVIVENEGEVELSFSTRVKLIMPYESYEKIVILEGYYKNCVGQLAYVTRNRNSSYSYLTRGLRLNRNLKVKLIGNKLVINKKSWEVTVDYTSLKKGKYIIGFPVKTVKKINPSYLDENKGGSRFAETWFPITTHNEVFIEKFIHFGYLSAGCVTVKYNTSNIKSNSWNLIFMKLITSRKVGNSLGVLEIV